MNGSILFNSVFKLKKIKAINMPKNMTERCSALVAKMNQTVCGFPSLKPTHRPIHLGDMPATGPRDSRAGVSRLIVICLRRRRFRLLPVYFNMNCAILSVLPRTLALTGFLA